MNERADLRKFILSEGPLDHSARRLFLKGARKINPVLRGKVRSAYKTARGTQQKYVPDEKIFGFVKGRLEAG